MGKGKGLGEKFLKNNGWFYEFLRSAVSSQCASWVDMGLRVLLFAVVFKHLDPFYRSNLSVAIGAVVGGIINCTINYRFTFHASGQNVKAVAVKYILVWVGSLLLNMYGTTYVAKPMQNWEWLHQLGFKPAGIFATATLVVSLIVSWAWNFVLQRNFVYRPRKVDGYFIRLVNIFIPNHSSLKD